MAEAEEEGTAVVVVVSVVNGKDAAPSSEVGMPLMLLVLVLLVLVLVLVLLILLLVLVLVLLVLLLVLVLVLVLLVLLPVGLRGTTASRAAATASIFMVLPSSLPSSSPEIKLARTRSSPLALLIAAPSRDVFILLVGALGGGMRCRQEGQQDRRGRATCNGKGRGPICTCRRSKMQARRRL